MTDPVVLHGNFKLWACDQRPPDSLRQKVECDAMLQIDWTAPDTALAGFKWCYLQQLSTDEIPREANPGTPHRASQ